MELKANASVQVSPKGSQIAVFLLISAAIIFFGWSCWLYMGDKKYALPLAGSGIFLILACVLWFYAHRNESLSHSHPLKVDLGDGDTRMLLSADSRSIPELDFLRGLINHYHMTFHRSPLPMASGEVDSSGRILKDSEMSAVAASEQLNRNAAEINAQAFDSALHIVQEKFQNSSSPVIAEVGTHTLNRPVGGQD